MQRENIWDMRYGVEGFAYGREPNDFLLDNIGILPAGGRILCLAEGEGRNAVFLAGHGFEVIAVDSSQVGLEKARKFATESQVEITTILADLAEFPIEENSFDGVVSIFCHLPPAARSRLHKEVVKGLKPGGKIILEGYTPDQLAHDTGGPPSRELMLTLELLRDDFRTLKFLHGCEIEREVVEGSLHTGLGAVVQFVAEKT